VFGSWFGRLLSWLASSATAQTSWSEPNYVAEHQHPTRTGYLYATSRLSTLPFLCAKRRTFPLLLLVGACAAVQALDMTPAA
jgi:hypothetical protein